jgi:hypothetical protein
MLNLPQNWKQTKFSHQHRQEHMLRQHGSAVFTELLTTVDFHNGTPVTKSVVKNKQHVYLLQPTPLKTQRMTQILGLVISQALIGRFLTAQARVQFQGSTPGICGGKGENYTGFTSEFSCAIRFITPKMFPTHSNIIWWGNGPTRGHSSTRTPSHCITRLTTKLASQRRIQLHGAESSNSW